MNAANLSAVDNDSDIEERPKILPRRRPRAAPDENRDPVDSGSRPLGERGRLSVAGAEEQHSREEVQPEPPRPSAPPATPVVQQAPVTASYAQQPEYAPPRQSVPSVEREGQQAVQPKRQAARREPRRKERVDTTTISPRIDVRVLAILDAAREGEGITQREAIEVAILERWGEDYGFAADELRR